MPVFLVVAAAAIHQYVRHRQNEINPLTKTPNEAAGDESASSDVKHDIIEHEEVLEIQHAPAQEEEHAIFDTVVNCCGADITGTIAKLSRDVSKETSVEVHPAGESEDLSDVHHEDDSSSCVLEKSQHTDSDSAVNATIIDATGEKLNDNCVSMCANYRSDREQNIVPPDDELRQDYYYQRLPTEETEDDECNHGQDNTIRKLIKKQHSRKNQKRWDKIRMRFFQQGTNGGQWIRERF